MKAKSVMQIEVIIRNRAMEENVQPQFVMQNYLLKDCLNVSHFHPGETA